jgi:hypothetical protein
MTSGFRLVLSVGLVLALFATANQLKPAWLGDVGLDWRGAVDAYRQIGEAREKEAEMDRQIEAVSRRMHIKHQITRDLIAGRRSLLEAAAWFCHAGKVLPGLIPDPLPFPGATPEEKYCRQVLCWVRTVLAQEAGCYPRGRAEQLGRELEEHLARPGGLRLPPISGGELASGMP